METVVSLCCVHTRTVYFALSVMAVGIMSASLLALVLLGCFLQVSGQTEGKSFTSDTSIRIKQEVLSILSRNESFF